MIKLLDVGMNLVQCKDIDFYGICTIQQPTVEMVFSRDNYSYADYRTALLPLMIDSKYVGLNMSNFDMLFEPELKVELQSKETEIFLLPVFVKYTLSLFVKEKVSYHEGYNCFYFDDDVDRRLDRDNFDEFSDIILKISNEEKLKKPNYEGLSKKKIALREKIRKREEQEKGKLTMSYVYSLVEYKKGYTKEEMNNLTMWKLMFLFDTIFSEESWNNNFQVLLNGGTDDNKIDKRHWMEKINIK